ncbi:hypothetical protein CYJ37_25455 [Bacillus sp. UMB0728]|uniref:Uncharacterized protein n=1 Tax=Bacillus infantis NRRL B-14911 TaxID=1367477 RepID=U5L659_9BACI|nr:hypothetical protein N288_00700 [Bacillus infantis NRRL B-14911]PLR70209.1 hypothetical protein CYJ37_25455 [Bacillus sp. UMB0728]
MIQTGIANPPRAQTAFTFHKTKRKRVFNSKTTFSHFDYYFISFPIIAKFIQNDCKIANKSESIMLAFYNTIIEKKSSQLFFAFKIK